MQLRAVLTKDDLVALVDEIAPLEVEISRRPRRAITVGRPSIVELVAGAGLRVRGEARFAWDALGLTIPVTVRAWQVLLVPAIRVNGGALGLAFDPELEELELSNVPSFVEDAIVRAVANGLGAQRSRLLWPFGRHLSLARSLSDRVSPPSRFELEPIGGDVVVTASEMQLTLRFAAHVLRGPTMAPVSSRRSA